MYSDITRKKNSISDFTCCHSAIGIKFLSSKPTASHTGRENWQNSGVESNNPEKCPYLTIERKCILKNSGSEDSPMLVEENGLSRT